MSTQNSHPQYKRTITSLEYERDRFAAINDDGTLDYYRIRVVENGPLIQFETSPPVITEGFVFLKKKVYRVTKGDLIKGYFHALSRITPFVKERKKEEVELDDEVSTLADQLATDMWISLQNEE